jgi:hypothetical protein
MKQTSSKQPRLGSPASRDLFPQKVKHELSAEVKKQVTGREMNAVSNPWTSLAGKY